MTFDPFQIGGATKPMGTGGSASGPGVSRANAQLGNPDPLPTIGTSGRGTVMNTTNFLANKNKITKSMNPNRAATMSILSQTGARA